MENKKRYSHQSYRRFSTYIDDWTKVSMALTHMDASRYDLTDEEVNEYISLMRKSQERYKMFKKTRLLRWRIAYISLCLFFFVFLLFTLPKIAITLLLWILFTTFFLVLYPLYVLYEGLECVFDKKYQDRYFEIDPYIEKMVDDYTWNSQVTRSVDLIEEGYE